MREVNVLGTIYTIIETSPDDSELLSDEMPAYTDPSVKKIYITNDTSSWSIADKEGFMRSIIRHEVVHAFFHECGLGEQSYGSDEELVDWIAVQFPKLAQAFLDLDIAEIAVAKPAAKKATRKKTTTKKSTTKKTTATKKASSKKKTAAVKTADEDYPTDDDIHRFAQELFSGVDDDDDDIW